MSRPPAAAPGQDAGGQGRGEGRGGHRRRDTLDRVWHYKGFASPAWTPQGNSIPRKPLLPVPQFPRLKTRCIPPAPRIQARASPRLARWSPGDAPRSRGGCARPLEAAAGGAGPGARSKPVRLPVCAAGTTASPLRAGRPHLPRLRHPTSRSLF